ncbi:hypothetical protein [Proteus vulgaris]|uniref:hypothetical protein n=1 Tax=Proteus vulgaris TaxID=585 RepID=UPI000F4D3882|nr:hypothetical protein [Proteus vulgaris]AYY82806.1 hypothetical protein EGX81_18910 [Proteus vulgaris]
MEHTKYYICINGVEIISAYNLDILDLNHIDNENIFFLLIKSDEIKISDSIKIKTNDIINISFYINNTCIYEFDSNLLDNEIKLNEGQNLSLTIKTTDLPPLAISNILKEWENGNEIFYWRSNKCEKSKKIWLNSCLYWQQTLPSNKNIILNPHINLDDVNNILDFFCMLGEAFWGRKGYIGKDFYGFNDLLGDLTANGNKINIYIKNDKKLKEFLERISPINHSYYDVFMSILVDNDCNIINVENKS